MSSRLGARSRTLVLSGVLTVLVSLLQVAPATAMTSHKPLNDTRPVVAGQVGVDFPIEYFGVVADLPRRSTHLPEQGRAPFGEARFRVDGRWTAWRSLGEDGAQAAGQFTGALMSVDRADAYQVRGLPPGARNWRAAAINTSDGPTVVVGRRPAGAAVGAPSCRSRADWGADESISGWSKGDTQDFAPVQVVTVHHTAGSNDAGQDYAATMRAIYSYHVKSNGWSDIGYQYLVDRHGTVYEGRSSGHTSRSCLYDGGDGSDFAHDSTTDEVVTGAHVAGYNTGNAGISLMGCYEPGSSLCTGATTPPATQVDALEAALALLAERHGIDPEGTVHYVNPANTKEVRAISGHRDYNSATECPGGTLHGQLPAIRSNVAARLVMVAFDRTRRTLQENAGTVALKVTRTGHTDVAATVDYARTSGTAAAGSDFSLPAGTLHFAPGETTKSIPVSILDDGAREGSETLTVSLRNPRAGTVLGSPWTTQVRIAASDQRPDGSISTAVRSGYVGNNVYNTTGVKQTKQLSARRTQTRTFYVRVQNDGSVRSGFRLTGTGAGSGSSVSYLVGGTNVTRAMRSAAGYRITLTPGAYKLLTVRIKLLRTAAFGSMKSAKVTASWTGDGTRRDTVKAVVKTVR